MNRKFLAAILLLVAVALGYAAWSFMPRAESGGDAKTTLTVYCAAGLKKPVEAIAEEYRKELGIDVSLQYAGTGTLLSQLQVAKRGDLFIAADDGSLADARSRNLTEEAIPMVVQHPVIAVKKGNPKNIRSLADLSRADVKFAIANPESASISKITKKLLGAQWHAFAAKVAVMKPTVTEVAADAQIGAVDAAILWDSTVPGFKELEAVEVPELMKHRENASAGVLAFTSQPQEALKFARYLAAPDRGGKVFQQHGFQLAEGDKWAVKPEMVLYSGGVNRPAIEKILQKFANREGVSVTTIFNGCGILCAQMKAIDGSVGSKFPDAYYACDVCFVPPVAEHFPEAVLLTETEIVIAVPKGNVKNIKTLADLAQPGLRVGLCNAEQSTLGFMTNAMLKASNLLEGVQKNVIVQVPTADFLVNQMRVGSLDAAIVYRVNVQHQAGHFDAIPLPADKAKAVQPFAVRHNSVNRQLSYRLLAFLRSNKESFEAAGFVWRGDEKAIPSDQLDIPPWLKGAGK